jgi:hypothetical protein
MAAKIDWVNGDNVDAAAMNALGTEVNGKQPLDADLTALAALSDPAGKLSGIAAGATANSSDATLLASAASAAASASKSADTITDGTTNKAYTATEKTKLGAITGTNTGDQTSVTGNAGTATKLATARTINGVSFDGTANITIADSTKEATANKGAANGYAPLDASQLVPAVNLPSYVDDVLEYTNLAAFPGTGTTGKIFVALDTGKIYRWSGSAYVEISPSPGSTDSVTEGSSNLYYTNARADARITAATATGTGSLVRATSPTLVTPALGTPASGNLASCTFPTLNQNTTGTAAVATKWVPRVGSTTSTATPSIDCALYEQYNITALAANITGVTVSNTFDGCKLLVRITGTATRTITWGSSFQSSGVATLPTTTSGTNTHVVGFLYDAVKSKFVCIAVDPVGY